MFPAENLGTTVFYFFHSQKQMEISVMESYDSIAIFLCIHVVHRYKVLMHKRSVPALDR